MSDKVIIFLAAALSLVLIFKISSCAEHDNGEAYERYTESLNEYFEEEGRPEGYGW